MMTRAEENLLEDPIFQLKAVALLLSKPHVLENYRDVLEAQMFFAEDYRQVVALILKHFKKYGEPPPLDDLVRLLPENEKTKPYNTEGWEGVVKEIKTAIKEENLQAIEDELGSFIKYQIYGAALSAAVEHRRNFQWDMVDSQMATVQETAARMDGDLLSLTSENGLNKVSALALGFRASLVNFVSFVPSEIPALNPDALYGLAGRIVKAIEPHTEAHPAALLGHILVCFGNVIGRGPHWSAESTRHGLNLFMTLVGETSRGRKGTAGSHIKRLFETIDESWLKNIGNGLSTGEGLIQAVRDPKEIEDDDGEMKITDHGVKDKRLLIIEPEFTQILKVMSREGNTLSPKMRQAWDDGNISTLTKNNPLKATGAHISIVAHITKEELNKRFRTEDATSGLGNRFLWVWTHRTKELPTGGNRKELDADLKELKNQLQKAFNWSRLHHKQIVRDKKAEKEWKLLYSILTKDYPGLFGKITARSEAQVMRLASIYAVLDKSRKITSDHLQAAHAFWQYCEDSCRFIFGDSLGDPTADAIIQSLKEIPAGLTQTEISVKVFKGNKKTSEIKPVLQQLIECQLIVEVKEKTPGRPSTRYIHILHFQESTKETNLTKKGNEVPPEIRNYPTQTNGNRQLTNITKPNKKKRTKFVAKLKKTKEGLDPKSAAILARHKKIEEKKEKNRAICEGIIKTMRSRKGLEEKEEKVH